MDDDAEKQLKKIIRLHVIKFLIIGNVLKKYPYSRGKAQMRHLKVIEATTKDARIMFGHPKKRKGYKEVPLIKVHSITSGKRTSALKRQKAAKSAHCFSIVETSRTLDLECDSKEDRDMWVAALRFLLLEDHIRQATTIKNASASSLIPPDDVQINCIIGHIAQHHPFSSEESSVMPSATPTTIPEESTLGSGSTLAEALTPTPERSLKEKSKSSGTASPTPTRDGQPSPSPQSAKTSSKPSSRSQTPKAGGDEAPSKEKRASSSRSSKKKSLKGNEAPIKIGDKDEEPPGKEPKRKKGPRPPKEPRPVKTGPRPPSEPRPASVKPITSPKVDVDAIEVAAGDATTPAWLTGSKKTRDSDDSGESQRATTPKARSSRKKQESLRRERSEVIKRKPKREKSDKSIKRQHSSTLAREQTKSKRAEKKPQPPKGPKPKHLKDRQSMSVSEAADAEEAPSVGGEVAKTLEKVDKEVGEDAVSDTAGAEAKAQEPEKKKAKEPEVKKAKEPEVKKVKEAEKEKVKETEKEKVKEAEKEKAKEPEKKKAKEPEKKAAKEPEKEKEDEEVATDSKAEKGDPKELMQKKLRANLEAALAAGTPPGSRPGSGRSSRRPSVKASSRKSSAVDDESPVAKKSEEKPKAKSEEKPKPKPEVKPKAKPEEKPKPKEAEKPKEKEKEKPAAKKRGLFGWGAKKEKADLEKEKQLKEQAKADRERAKLEEKQKKEQAKADARAAKEKARSSKRERKKSDEKDKKAAAKADAKAKEEKDKAREEKKSAAEKMLAAQSGAVAGPVRPPGPRRPGGPKPTSTKEQGTPPRKKSSDADSSANGVDTSSTQASKVSDYVSKINKLDPSKFGKFMMMPSQPNTPRHGGTLPRKTNTGSKNGTSSSRGTVGRSSLRVPTRSAGEDDDTEDDTEDEGSDGDEPSRANGVEIFDDDEEEEEEEKDVRSSSNFNKNLMFGQSVLAALLAKGPPPKAVADGPARLEGDGVDDGETGKSEIEHIVMARPTVGAKRKSRRPARRKKVTLEVDDLGLDF